MRVGNVGEIVDIRRIGKETSYEGRADLDGGSSEGVVPREVEMVKKSSDRSLLVPETWPGACACAEEPARRLCEGCPPPPRGIPKALSRGPEPDGIWPATKSWSWASLNWAWTRTAGKKAALFAIMVQAIICCWIMKGCIRAGFIDIGSPPPPLAGPSKLGRGI